LSACVTPPRDIRHSRRFVQKALVDARSIRAWNGSEVARRTGVSRQTINRWIRGDWASDPEPARVVAFCEALGINPTAAFGILGWDRSHRPGRQPAPPPMDPDVEALLRRTGRSGRVDGGEIPHQGDDPISRHRPPLPDDREMRTKNAG